MSALPSELLAVVCGLAAAASWGAGDFSGGIATKRTPAHMVLLLSQFAGGLLLLGLTGVFVESVPSLDILAVGCLAGLFGAAGLLALYSGLAQGRMGLVSPLAAVIAAVLPVLVGVAGEGMPAPQRLAGFGIGLAAVWFLTRGEGGAAFHWKDLRLPLAAGIAFSLFFILIDRASTASVLWPLVAARGASVLLLLLYSVARRRARLPGRSQLGVIALAGIFDSGGNAFFALATRIGRLDIATVLGSLYPAGTVLLAWLLLKERLGPRQWAGVLMALAALVLIAL